MDELLMDNIRIAEYGKSKSVVQRSVFTNKYGHKGESSSNNSKQFSPALRGIVETEDDIDSILDMHSQKNAQMSGETNESGETKAKMELDMNVC